MKQTKLDIIKGDLIELNYNKFNLYSGYGFNVLQVKELFEYEKFHVMNCIRAGYIIPDMTIAQIREVMRGIYSIYMKDMDVRIYANPKYNHNFMRIIRILLEWDIDTIMIELLLAKGDFNIKEFFILVLMTLVDSQDINANIRFVKKCTDQVLDLYKAYRPIFNVKDKYTLEQVLKSFELDVYLAKIEWLRMHRNESI